jgi:hypothetical protein
MFSVKPATSYANKFTESKQVLTLAGDYTEESNTEFVTRVKSVGESDYIPIPPAYDTTFYQKIQRLKVLLPLGFGYYIVELQVALCFVVMLYESAIYLYYLVSSWKYLIDKYIYCQIYTIGLNT